MHLLFLSLQSHPSLFCSALLCSVRNMGADYLPFLAMFLVQLGYAGMNIFVKLAMDSGMNPFILIAYRQIMATVAMAPFAYFLERKRRPKITRAVLVQSFFCSVFGATLNQILYFIGLKHSNPTLGCAFNNLLPAMTFLLAVPCRVETVGIRTRAEQAKVLGTAVCIGGAMVLTFYRGHTINIGQSGIHWKYAEQLRTQDSQTGANFILGPLLLITSCVSWAIWFIIQGRMSEKFTAPYTSSTLMCFMASVECGVIALLVDHNPSAWALNDSIRLVSALYSAIVGTALAFSLMSWTIQRKGPLYVSVFSPLLLVIVALLSWALLGDNLHFGTVVGSIFVVLGLYAVLWGKGKEEGERERDTKGEAEDQGKESEDLEIQMDGKLYIKG